MKKNISVIMVFLITLSIIFSSFTFAATKKTIYNCGDYANISYIEENGKKYTAASSLRYLDIEIEEFADHICLSTNSKNAEIYTGSSMVHLGNTTLFYKNPMIKINDCKYISLDLIAMLFSQIYEETDDSINLWITFAPLNSAKGIISLPNGETAPKGGVKAKVYAFQRKLTSYAVAPTPTIGYKGVYFFDKPFAYENVLLAEKEIIIEEGESQAEFFLSDADENFGTSSYIGYHVDDNGCFSEGKTEFNYKEEQQYNFVMNQYSIQGTVEIFETAAEDSKFCIKAIGNQSYEAYGVIPKGETRCDYRISVPSGTYKVKAVFENKDYKIADYPENVTVFSESANNITLGCAPSGKVSVKLTLPAPAKENIWLNVFLQSADEPYYYLDSQRAFISAGEKSACVELTDEHGFENLICYYELEKETDDLNGFGYYNENGTDRNLHGAQTIKADSDISMELLGETATSENLAIEAWTENEKAYINIKNKSALDRKNINVFMASYNAERLDGLSAVTVKKLLKGSADTISFDIPNSDTIKVFAWCDMKPFSKSVYIKENGIYNNRNVQMRLCADSCIIYKLGEQITWDTAPIINNGVLLAPMRPFAEALNCNIRWDSETNTAFLEIGKDIITIQTDNRTALFNGNAFELSEPMCTINDIIYIPAADIAERFGYTSEFNIKTGELFLYFEEDTRLVNEARAYGDLPEYLFSKDMSAPMTRLDAAQILAALCETITVSELEYSDVPIYSDTDDISVLKVSKAGILTGKENNLFYPDLIITNAEFACALRKTLIFSGESPEYNEDITEKFYDDADIPLYAKNAVYSLKEYRAFENICDKIFSPNEDITIKRAIATAQNCLNSAYYSIFFDIAPDSRYRKAIIRLYRMKVMSGYEDGGYRPNAFFTRAEASVVITKMQDGVTINDFLCEDVGSSWYQGYAGYCVKNKIMDLQGGKFFPHNYLTGIDAVSAMLRILGYADLNSNEEISEIALSIGLTDGIYKLDSASPISREKLAQLIYNTLKIEQKI